jgi:hypothetical protein
MRPIAPLTRCDRAPDALRRIGGDLVRRLFERIDASQRAAEVLSDPRLPERDAVVHVAVWAQGRWTDTRAVEASKVEANVIGTALGAVSVAFCYMLCSAVSALLRVSPRPR